MAGVAGDVGGAVIAIQSPYPWFGDCAPDSGVRFWSKVDFTGSCWIWTASKRNKGYGAFCLPRHGKVVHGRAHRISYELFNGPIPDGLMVLHRCDNPACLNPAHLFLGTNQDNVDDMVSKGRHVPGGTLTKPQNARYERGTAHHAARLNDEIVRQIRADRASGMTVSQLASKHGLRETHAWKVATGRLWKHV